MKPHETAAILYTGGTTGIPKGTMLTHDNLQTSAFNVAHYERSTETDRALCFLPLSHVVGSVRRFGACLMPRLPTVTPRQLVGVLEKAGFEIDHQTGWSLDG